LKYLNLGIISLCSSQKMDFPDLVTVNSNLSCGNVTQRIRAEDGPRFKGMFPNARSNYSVLDKSSSLSRLAPISVATIVWPMTF